MKTMRKIYIKQSNNMRTGQNGMRLPSLIAGISFNFKYVRVNAGTHERAE